MDITTIFIIAFFTILIIGVAILGWNNKDLSKKSLILVIGFLIVLFLLSLKLLSCSTVERTVKEERYLTVLHPNVFNKETKYVFYSTTTDQHYLSISSEDYNNIKNTIGNKEVVDTLIVNGEYRILFSDKQTLKVELKAPPSFKPNQEESLNILKNVS